MMKKKLGIMGGTFDPIHIGHLLMARHALENLRLDNVVFIPSGSPPHKDEKAKPLDRLTMVEIALESERVFYADPMEIERSGITYSLDTLRYLQSADPDVELYYIIGEDTLYDLENWKHFGLAALLCTFALCLRPGNYNADVDGHIYMLASKYGAKFIKVDSPIIEISSTQIRQRVADALSISHMVPDDVDDYIKKRRLYKRQPREKKAADIDYIKADLKLNLSKGRYNHSISVMKTAVKLAEYYNADAAKAALAGLLHDCAKELPKNELRKMAVEYNPNLSEIVLATDILLHAPASAYTAINKYGITDRDIILSIEHHITGDRHMGLLEKIIYLADFIEPNRNFPDAVNVRNIAYDSLDIAVLATIDSILNRCIEKNYLIFPNTFKCRNWLLTKNKN